MLTLKQMISKYKLISKYSPIFNDPYGKAFENIVRKEKSAGYQHFLHFPQYFLPLLKEISNFQSHIC